MRKKIIIYRASKFLAILFFLTPFYSYCQNNAESYFDRGQTKKKLAAHVTQKVELVS